MHVVLDVLRVDADLLLEEDGFLAGLVKIIAGRKHRETRGDRPVKQVRLGEAEHERARKASKLRGERQRFAETEEIVGLVGEADKTACQATDAALQTDGLLAFFLELEGNVHGSGFAVALDFGGLVRFDFVEIVKLIEAKDAELPQTLVEELAFINHQFAANDFVAGGGVAAEVDAVNVVLFLFVEAERQVDDLVGIVYFGVRLRREINEAVLAINLAVGFKGFADFFGGENVPLLERERGLERIHFERQSLVRVGADDFERAHAEAFALFDGDGDIDGLAVAPSGDERNAQAGVRGVHIFENGLADGNLEVAVVAVESANANFEV